MNYGPVFVLVMAAMLVAIYVGDISASVSHDIKEFKESQEIKNYIRLTPCHYGNPTDGKVIEVCCMVE